MAGYDPRGQVNRALLVGVSEYDFGESPHGVLRDLPAVKHNLNRLRDALQRGRVFGEREIVLSRSPTLDDFSRSLRTVAEEAEGVLLLYFAGHGAMPSAGDELFLQMRNASVVAGGHAVFPGAEMFTTVLTVLAAGPARRIVIVLDCCFAGNAAWLWEACRDKRRVLLLMSVQANHRIDAGDPDTPTPFTAELLRLLEERGERGGEELWFGGLAPALRDGMAAGGHRTAQRAAPWEPQSRAEPGEDVLLWAPSAGPGPPVPPPAGAEEPGEAERPGEPGQPGAPGEPGGAGAARPGGRGVVKPGGQPGGRAGDRAGDRVGGRAGHRAGGRAVGRAGKPRGRGFAGRMSAAVWPTAAGARNAAGARIAAAAGDATEVGDAAASGAVLRPRRFGRRSPAVLGAVLVLTVTVCTGVYRLVAPPGDGVACVPPPELRVLTDPELEPTVRAAADAYLTSEENTTDDGCRRAGLTVYSAGTADAVTALSRRTGAWQEPGDDPNPQRDVGPQPDVWIPASPADVARVESGRDTDAVAELEADQQPFAYSPVVLAVPRELAAEAPEERVAVELNRMIDALRGRRADAGVRRPDPEFADTGLLATIGLYGTHSGAEARDAAGAERRVAQPGPPAPTAAELLCALPDDDAVDDRTAALVPEFLMRSGVACDSERRTPRTAQYPGDVPGLEPVFVRVRWRGADRDAERRDAAADGFRGWLTGTGGREVFAGAGFRAADGERALLDEAGRAAGVLAAPSPLIEPAGRDAMEAALEAYRNVNGPGRVLFLLDSSRSMRDVWDGPSGGPGLIARSLGGLGARDEYGVWAVHGTGGTPYETLLPTGPHRRRDAERALDRAAVTRSADDADPYRALLAAFDHMERRNAGRERPGLIVYVTDDEDAGLLGGGRVDAVLDAARAAEAPVTMVSLADGGCDPGRPDARIAEASGGRCLDAGDDPGAALHDEVARTGTGEEE